MSPRHPGRSHAPGAQAKNFKQSLKRLLSTLAPEKIRLALVMVLTVIGVVLNVMGPKALGHATNVIFRGVLGTAMGRMLPAGTTTEQALAMLRASGDSSRERMASMIEAMHAQVGVGINTHDLAHELFIVVALYTTSAIIMYIQGYILAGVIQRTGNRLRAGVESTINHLPLKAIDSGSRGDMLSRVTNDVDNVTQTLQQTLSQVMQASVTIVATLGMMIWISWHLALAAIVTIPVAAILAVVIGKKAQPHFKQQWASTGALGATVEEAFTAHEVVTAFACEEDFDRTFARDNDSLYRSAWRAQFLSGTIQPAMNLINNLTFVIVAVLGGIKITNGSLTLGDVQAFLQYSRSYSQPIAQLASVANLLQSGVASAERVFEILDIEPEPLDDAAPATLPQTLRGSVTFDHVRFSYDPEKELIRDLSLTVQPGQTVAIVGPTGAGKTTLVNLLLRFYEPLSGHIAIDDVDISTVRRDDVREHIGMVLQDTWLFDGTIEENIAFGLPEATHEQVVEAARAANVLHVIEALPQGFNTVIDDSGSGVSTGEKQLITIARAFLADRQILILDEATSSVDTRTEVLVQQAMAKLRSGRTSFVIAHRLSTIRDADIIVVMEDGDIVETGNHDTLMEAGGAYARLYQSQFDGES
ncbi:ABC transporter ATP-binding protein [Actinomyces vulturis]|uniref:ABC transporter ATP-binding protein n=1 Tax=Actinomyces vulturis TaxID=1857645 RepID=UPI00083762A3|nr:ABC transporter ATP-binding protein [Actinomyces vulturis]